MRRAGLLSIFLIAAVVITGCETTGKSTTNKTVGGGLIGAAVGGIIGHQRGRGLEGAAIGGIAGGLIGNQMDKNAKAVNPNHMPLTQIAEMTAKEIPDGVIIDEIKRTNSVYELNSELISYLKDSGASDRLIDYMMSTGK